MICSFTVPGDVVPWARAGAHGKIHFTPARQRSFMGVLRSAAYQAMGGRLPIDDPVELCVVACYRPPSRTRAEQALPWAGFKRTKPDCSNIVKIIEDALNAIVWTDDSRVAVSHVAKVYGPSPGLRVSVHALSPASWPFLAAESAGRLFTFSEAA